MVKRLFLFITLFVFIPSLVWATDYYVNGSTGNDSYNGLYETYQGGSDGPWLTLGHAASNVPDAANHTINVAAGTYEEELADSRSGSSPGYRHWLASGTVTIDDPSSSDYVAAVELNGDYIKFDGFKVTGPSASTAAGIRTGQDSDHNVITNCEVYNIEWTLLDIRGTNHTISSCDLHNAIEDYIYVFGSGHTFIGNYVHNYLTPSGNPHADVWQTWHSGSYGQIAAQDVTIERNHIFFGNDSTGALQGEDGNQESFHVFMWEDDASRHASGLTIRNNIFECLGGFNSHDGHADGLRCYNNLWRSDDDLTQSYTAAGLEIYNADDIEVKNNMFIDGVTGVTYSSCTNQVNATNLFWRGDSGSTSNSGYSSSGDVVNDNPDFVTYDNDTYNLTTAYKLQAGSPAIDAGTTVSSVTDDYEGESRTGTYEIGAFIYEDEEPTPILSGSIAGTIQ